MKKPTIKIVVCGGILFLAAIALFSCEGELFDPANVIGSQRFLGIVAEPPEAAPGEQILFSAVMTNPDGTLHEGPIAWVVVPGDALRIEGEEVQIDEGDSYLQMPGEAGFLWTVPEREALEAKYGPMQKNGLLLTVAVAAFEDGDLEGDAITAFKLFIVSERAPDQRFSNPSIEHMLVLDDFGVVLEPDENGDYVTQSDRVHLRATPHEQSDALTYHWFSTSEELEPDLGDTQTLSRSGDPERVVVYCVLRKSYYFEHEDNSSTRVTGIDWLRVQILFQ